MEVAESIRIQPKIPKEFWLLFVFHAVYLLNQRPHAALSGKTPFEAWWGRKPSLRHLRVGGCDAWVLNPLVKRKAQDHHARRGIFVGYAPTQNGYRVWDLEKKRVVVSQHVLFNETAFKFGRKSLNAPQPHDLPTQVYIKSDESPNVSVPDDDLPTIVPKPPGNLNQISESNDSDSFSSDAKADDSGGSLSRNYYDVLSDVENDADNHESDDDADLNGPAPGNELTETQAHNEYRMDVAPDLRRSSRNRRQPGEWWRTDQSANVAKATETESWFDDARRHIEYFALRATSKNIDKVLHNDSLPRPPLTGIRACDIKTNMSLREALNGPYGGYFCDAATKSSKTWYISGLGNYETCP
jgi:hypothetical protein